MKFFAFSKVTLSLETNGLGRQLYKVGVKILSVCKGYLKVLKFEPGRSYGSIKVTYRDENIPKSS